MKKLLVICSFLLVLVVNSVDAANIRSIGSVPADTTGAGYGGKLVFPSTGSGVFVNNDNYLLNPNSNLQISGSFWLSNLSTVADPSLGWVTFDIGTVPGASNVVLINNLNNTFTFSGYAWSKGAGWIYFSPALLKDTSNNDIANSKVIYNKTTGLVSGCAWSQNLGWLCFDGITLDMTPPDLTNILKPTAANSSKTFTLLESATIEIDNWTSVGVSTYSGTYFTHDIRKAKFYHIKVTDTSGNFSTGLIQVVANIPSKTLNSNNIGEGASLYNSTVLDNVKADGYDKHSINIKLRDTYGNLVIPVDGVKEVFVTLGFDNSIDLNQFSNSDLGDAVKFEIEDFFFNPGRYIETSNLMPKNDGNYKLDFSSYAPSKSGYTYTQSNNDIKVNKLIINVTALGGNTGVGEGSFDEKDNYPNVFAFIPAVSVTGILNSNSWNITRDNETSFTGVVNVIKTSGSSNINNIQITHILDVMSGSTYKNDLLSFQDLVGTTGASVCVGNNTSTGYYQSNISCNKYSPNKSSNIIRNHGDKNSSTTIYDIFRATPRIVASGLSKMDTRYSSEVSYTIDGKNVKYPSFFSTYGSNIINNEVKITGIVNKNNNNFSVVSDSSINYIGNITKSDVYTQVHKNVVKYQKSGTGGLGVMYKKGDYTLNSWPVGIDTIIVDGGDLIINDNIYKIAGKVRTIIALKTTSGTKGNIWINNGVQFVGATLIADRSVISGNGTTYLSDTASAINQLFIKGSVISYNTVGGSSKSPSVCPFYISKVNCTLQTSKRYDFNHFRSYINGVQGTAVNGSTYGVNMSLSGYANAPMIIEYDSDIQKYPPNILQK